MRRCPRGHGCHEWLVKFVEHRIADPRVIRHIKKWLNAGVMEGGRRIRLRVVVQGHCRYYGVPRNGPALKSFRFGVIRLWRQALARRSQKGRPNWDWMYRLGLRWVPLPRICHPYPDQRLRVMIRGKSPVR